jgi:hypothetical protein
MGLLSIDKSSAAKFIQPIRVFRGMCDTPWLNRKMDNKTLGVQIGRDNV